MKQTELAAALGIHPAVVTRLKARGMPTHDVEAARAWRQQHVRPHGTAAAPTAEAQQAQFDLTRERALLMRLQRREAAIRVAVAERTFAPVEMLAAVLAAVSAATAGRLEALPLELRRACPELSTDAIAVVARTVTALRAQWADAAIAAATEAAETFDAYPPELTDDDDDADPAPPEA